MGALVKKDSIKTVRQALEQMKPQFALALPKHLTPDRLMRVALSTISVTPELLDCDRGSLYAAVMTAAQLGLEPDGILGQAYLVPFKKRVQLIVGYKGYLVLARNSGEIRDIRAHAVFDKDTFTYAFGLEERLDHVPSLADDRGKIRFVYAVAVFKDGGHHFEVMPIAEVEAIRRRAPGGNSDAWKNHYEQMALKTIIRRLAKFLPLSIQRAAALEDAHEQGQTAAVGEDGGIVIDVPEEPLAVTQEQEAKTEQEAAKSRLDGLAIDGKEKPELSDQSKVLPPTRVEVPDVEKQGRLV